MERSILGQLMAEPPEGELAAPDIRSFSGASRSAVIAVTQALEELAMRGEISISPELIHDDGFQDRITIDDDGLPELRDSIQRSGQRVPVLVRPHPDHPGHYRLVYGRRRLAAIRELDLQVKALVQNLNDEDAILAKGQENSGRRNPSFIEKALFAKQLRAGGHRASLIYEALLVDGALLSRMKAVTDAVPELLIRTIGAAHGVGRRRWEELAALTKSLTTEETIASVFLNGTALEATSNQRFEAALRHLASRRSTSGQTRALVQGILEARLSDGRTVASVRASWDVLKIEVSKKDHPEFAAWLETERDWALSVMYRIWSGQNSPP